MIYMYNKGITKYFGYALNFREKYEGSEKNDKKNIYYYIKLYFGFKYGCL